MKGMQPGRSGARVTMQQDIARVVADLYILSSAAAQLGGYGLDVPCSQWQVLIQQTQAARAVLGPGESTAGSDAHTAGLCRLATMFEDIVGLYTTRRRCPPAIWREWGGWGATPMHM